MSVAPNLVLRQKVLVLFQLFFVSLEVLDHQILSSQLVVVGEMVDDLVIGQSDASIK